MNQAPRRVLVMAALALVSITCTLLLGAGAALAETEATTETATEEAGGQSVSGTLKAAGEPLVGVEIVVREAGGGEVGTGVSGDDGRWEVVLPGAGEYEIELLPDTLPEGVALRDPDRNPLTVNVRAGRSPPVIFSFGEQIIAPTALEQLPQQALNGLKFGVIIAMTAVGLSLVFGTMGLINFAHGEFVTLGAVVAWFLNVEAGMHMIPATLLATAVGVAFGATLNAGLFRKLQKRGVRGFQFLVLTVGLSLFMQSVLRLWFGSGRRSYVGYRSQSAIDVGPLAIIPRDLAIIVLSSLALVGVAVLLTRTRIGKAMRAVADNRDLAEASGIDVARVVLVVWALGSGLAALGGVFQGLASSVEPLLGFKLLLLMFAAVILGGLGTAYGAMLGGIVVGLVSEVSVIWFPSEVKSAWALLVLILVLLVRPQGILGMRERLG